MATTLKIATVVIKALVKPIAGVMKKNAVAPGNLRSICSGYGQIHNRFMRGMQLISMGHKNFKIKPLPEDEAVKLGADVLAEGLVIGTAQLAIQAEVIRKTRADRFAEAEKEAKAIDKKKNIEIAALEKEQSLRRKLVKLEERIIDMENEKIAQLHDKIVKEQLKHIAFSESLLERIEQQEDRLRIAHKEVHIDEFNAPKKFAIVNSILPETITKTKHTTLDEDFGSVLDDVKQLEAVIEKEIKSKKQQEQLLANTIAHLGNDNLSKVEKEKELMDIVVNIDDMTAAHVLKDLVDTMETSKQKEEVHVNIELPTIAEAAAAVQHAAETLNMKLKKNLSNNLGSNNSDNDSVKNSDNEHTLESNNNDNNNTIENTIENNNNDNTTNIDSEKSHMLESVDKIISSIIARIDKSPKTPNYMEDAVNTVDVLQVPVVDAIKLPSTTVVINNAATKPPSTTSIKLTI